MLQFRTRRLHGFRQREAAQMLTDDLGVGERLGFDGHERGRVAATMTEYPRTAQAILTILFARVKHCRRPAHIREAALSEPQPSSSMRGSCNQRGNRSRISQAQSWAS